jgi:hypothetical protein
MLDEAVDAPVQFVDGGRRDRAEAGSRRAAGLSVSALATLLFDATQRIGQARAEQAHFARTLHSEFLSSHRLRQTRGAMLARRTMGSPGDLTTHWAVIAISSAIRITSSAKRLQRDTDPVAAWTAQPQPRGRQTTQTERLTCDLQHADPAIPP